MNKLTAEKCRDLIDDLKSHKVAGFRISSARECYLAALEIALPILEQQERGEGWIEWGGGNQPVGDGREVAIKFRDGTVMTETLSDCWVWSHSGDEDDIIAYRIIPERDINHNGDDA